MIIYDNLVGGLEHEFYDFPYIGNIIIPTDEVIFFRGRYTTNQNWEIPMISTPWRHGRTRKSRSAGHGKQLVVLVHGLDSWSGALAKVMNVSWDMENHWDTSYIHQLNDFIEILIWKMVMNHRIRVGPLLSGKSLILCLANCRMDSFFVLWVAQAKKSIGLPVLVT